MQRVLGAAALGLAGGCIVFAPSAATVGTKLAACDENQVPMSTTAALTSGTTVTGVVGAWTWGTSPCLLNTRLTFIVKRWAVRPSPGGAVRAISGNPGVAH